MKKWIKKTLCVAMTVVCALGVTSFVSCGGDEEKLTREIYTVQDFLQYVEEYRDKEHKGTGFGERTIGSFRLMADLDFTGVEYEPLNLQMDFDGNGHALNNITINEDEEYYKGSGVIYYGVGIFSSNTGKSVGTIKNLTVNNLLINYTGERTPVGGLLGYYNGNRHEEKNSDGEEVTLYEPIENVKINGKINAPNTWYVGGLVGVAYQGVVKNCEVDVEIIGGDRTGGVIGGQQTETLVTQTEVHNTVNKGSVNGGKNVGGIMGFYGMFYGCKNDGEIEGKEKVGGIVGQTEYDIKDCTNRGKVRGTSANKINDGTQGGSIKDGDEHAQVGGIVGAATGNGTLSGCKNIGEVSAIYDRVGGIAGYCKRDVTDCQNEGKVAGDDHVGGIIGCWDKAGALTNCKNSGDIDAHVYVGGLIGWISVRGTANVYCCENTATVKADVYAAGYVGGSKASLDEDALVTNIQSGEIDCNDVERQSETYNKID